MRVINVITIKHNIIDDIESFGIYEEQLSDEILEIAEKRFIEKIKEMNHFPFTEEDIDSMLDDGYYEEDMQSVCLSWSEI